jgi:hypothetical protein
MSNVYRVFAITENNDSSIDKIFFMEDVKQGVCYKAKKEVVITLINKGSKYFVESQGKKQYLKVVANSYLRTDPNETLEDNLASVEIYYEGSIKAQGCFEIGSPS